MAKNKTKISGSSIDIRFSSLLFRQFYSTETVLLLVSADLFEATDHGNHILLGLFDISAAIDMVDQDIPIERLPIDTATGQQL